MPRDCQPQRDEVIWLLLTAPSLPSGAGHHPLTGAPSDEQTPRAQSRMRGQGRHGGDIWPQDDPGDRRRPRCSPEPGEPVEATAAAAPPAAPDPRRRLRRRQMRISARTACEPMSEPDGTRRRPWQANHGQHRCRADRDPDSGDCRCGSRPSGIAGPKHQQTCAQWEGSTSASASGCWRRNWRSSAARRQVSRNRGMSMPKVCSNSATTPAVCPSPQAWIAGPSP